MQLVGSQWRINTLPNGLLLTAPQFESYRQHPIYFFDSAEQHLGAGPAVESATRPGRAWLSGCSSNWLSEARGTRCRPTRSRRCRRRATRRMSR